MSQRQEEIWHLQSHRKICKGVLQGEYLQRVAPVPAFAGRSDHIARENADHPPLRVRFARLSRLKLILGGKPEELDIPEEYKKVVEDDEYLVLDLVLNWVSRLSPCHMRHSG